MIIDDSCFQRALLLEGLFPGLDLDLIAAVLLKICSKIGYVLWIFNLSDVCKRFEIRGGLRFVLYSMIFQLIFKYWSLRPENC
jgi:hypothetical protein